MKSCSEHYLIVYNTPTSCFGFTSAIYLITSFSQRSSSVRTLLLCQALFLFHRSILDFISNEVFQYYTKILVEKNFDECKICRTSISQNLIMYFALVLLNVSRGNKCGDIYLFSVATATYACVRDGK